MAAYYLKGVAPDWRLSDIYWGMAQFMVLQVIGLLLCIVFPGDHPVVPALALRPAVAW